MQLKYLAHSAFLFTSNESTTLLTDPYETGCYNGALNYAPIDEPADIITISHKHADHSYIAPHHQRARIINKASEINHQDVKITGINTFHDQNTGQDRGSNIIFIIKIAGITFCHLGDLGHNLDDIHLEKIGPIDVLLIPVGGIYTITAADIQQIITKIAPKICIPMHYKTPNISFELAPVDLFTHNQKNVRTLDSSHIELTKNNLPITTEILVLTPEKLRQS